MRSVRTGNEKSGVCPWRATVASLTIYYMTKGSFGGGSLFLFGDEPETLAAVIVQHGPIIGNIAGSHNVWKFLKGEEKTLGSWLFGSSNCRKGIFFVLSLSPRVALLRQMNAHRILQYARASMKSLEKISPNAVYAIPIPTIVAVDPISLDDASFHDLLIETNWFFVQQGWGGSSWDSLSFEIRESDAKKWLSETSAVTLFLDLDSSAPIKLTVEQFSQFRHRKLQKLVATSSY